MTRRKRSRSRKRSREVVVVVWNVVRLVLGVPIFELFLPMLGHDVSTSYDVGDVLPNDSQSRQAIERETTRWTPLRPRR